MRALSPFAVTTLLAVLSSCSERRPPAGSVGPSGPSSSAAAEPELKPPEVELPDGVHPRRYSATLSIDPTQETFTGKVAIDVETKAPTRVIWLHGRRLQVTRATVKSGADTLPARVVTPTKMLLGLVLPKALPLGAAALEIEYTGRLSTKSSVGATRQRERDDWYVYTHFEPIDARRVFPCFDEPRFKVPWRLTLRVPARDRAFANTAPVADEPEAGGAWHRVKFAETKPLPSYLIAFAVGPLEAVPAGKSRVSGTPVRIIVPRGQAAGAAWAASVTAEILARLEEYFALPYAYGKLDMIAVPFFGGAMENPGLVTFGSQIILRRPGQETDDFKRTYARIAAHELAHQWFGDLVTNARWDEVWLNEAFATWMTAVIIEPWQPSWGTAEGRVGTQTAAMAADSLKNARRVRQPIRGDHDIANAFDSITYLKGASVIRMVEYWVGPDKFRRGLQRYMKEHANRTATARDLFAALSAEAGRDIAPAFSTFVDQTGVPLVTLSLRCEGGKASLELAQERYLPLGSSGQRQRLWQIPVCVRHGRGAAGTSACTLLSGAKGTLPLGSECPSWLAPNDGARGYYHADVGAAMLRRQIAGADPLSVGERLAALRDTRALVKAGKISIDEALRLVPELAREADRHLVETAIAIADELRRRDLITAALRPAYAAFIGRAFGDRARKLGWTPAANEPADTRLLRPKLLLLAADNGEDAALAAEAGRLARRWLADRRAVDPSVLDAVLRVAGQNGDAAFFDAVLAQARKEKDLPDRRRLLAALASVRDPALVGRALGLVLEGPFDIREATRILFIAAYDPATREQAQAYVRSHYDAIRKRVSEATATYLTHIGTAGCDARREPEIRAFYEPRSKGLLGAPRVLAQGLEEMRLCSTLREAQAPQLTKFLSNGSGSGSGSGPGSGSGGAH